jgi:hypothetical protein
VLGAVSSRIVKGSKAIPFFYMNIMIKYVYDKNPNPGIFEIRDWEEYLYNMGGI